MDSVVSNRHQDLSNFESKSIPNEILPRYPLESESETLIIPEEMNPDIIEGPPKNIDDEVGAINQGQLGELTNNEVTVLFIHI